MIVHNSSRRNFSPAQSDYRGERKIWVTGVLFLHRISDNKFSQTAGRISRMLKSLCGDDAMSHLTLCTTMWDKVDVDEGFDRLDQLSDTGALKEMISKGASVVRISNVGTNAKAEAEKIVSQLIKNAGPVELAIQDEMVNQHKTVLQTGAGQILDEHLREVREQAELERKELSDRLTKEKEDIAAKAQAEIDKKVCEMADLKEQEEKRAREQREEIERIQREKEEADEKMRKLSEEMKTANDENAARAAEAVREHKLAVEALEERERERARKQQIQTDELKLASEKAADDLKQLMVRAEEDRKAAEALQQKAMAEQERLINEVKRQAAELSKPRRSFWSFWWLNPGNW